MSEGSQGEDMGLDRRFFRRGAVVLHRREAARRSLVGTAYRRRHCLGCNHLHPFQKGQAQILRGLPC